MILNHHPADRFSVEPNHLGNSCPSIVGKVDVSALFFGTRLPFELSFKAEAVSFPHMFLIVFKDLIYLCNSFTLVDPSLQEFLPGF